MTIDQIKDFFNSTYQIVYNVLKAGDRIADFIDLSYDETGFYIEDDCSDILYSFHQQIDKTSAVYLFYNDEYKFLNVYYKRLHEDRTLTRISEETQVIPQEYESEGYIQEQVVNHSNDNQMIEVKLYPSGYISMINLSHITGFTQKNENVCEIHTNGMSYDVLAKYDELKGLFNYFKTSEAS